MPRQRRHCPECGRELVNGRCEDPDCRAVVQQPAVRWQDPEQLTQLFSALSRHADAFVLPLRGALVFPGCTAPFYVQLTAASQAELQQATYLVRRAVGLRDQQWTEAHTRMLLCHIAKSPPETVGMSYIESVGAIPFVQFSSEGRPYFPNLALEGASRRLGTHYYTGPVLSPKRNGAFDKFLDSVRCADAENRRALHDWLIGQLLYGRLKPGGAPALLLCADQSGIGKTETAKAIGHILGGATMQEWSSLSSMDGLKRRLLDDRVCVLVIDNLAPKAMDQSITHYADLASLITSDAIQTKTLYAHGETQKVNRVAYIITANTPLLTPELQSRNVVVTLGPAVKRQPNWLAQVCEQRVAIVEDMLAEIIDNWQIVLDQSIETDLRWDSWAVTVAHVTGELPRLQRGQSALIDPFDWVLEQIWEDPDSRRCEIGVIIQRLALPRVRRRYGAVLGQQHVSTQFLEELLKSGRLHRYGLIEEGNTKWVDRYRFAST